jgi:beta-lactamase superfamily II metal-dependent hydrolase
MIDRVSVRMYKVGFGDCFLLRFWTGDVVTGRVLIDCGSITEGKASVDRVVADIIDTCTRDGAARIDLVVGTHRHKDHVGGFSNPAWAGVEVGEVWLPWTEDPVDPEATRIRERQSSLAAALAAGLDADDEPLAAILASREDAATAALRAHRAMALNALTNEKAMATLHGGFANRPAPTFLPLSNTACEARVVGGLDGLTIHVLGPPRDTRAMAMMNPPDGAGYLAAATAARSNGTTRPFSQRWVMDEASWRAQAAGTTFRPDCQKVVGAIADQPMGALAAALDNALNNTSLILMFEVAGQWLLFPADAQWGAWDAAMRQPAARALLEKTTFYKVGHHGSHNATPRALIEDLVPKGFTAMLSTGRVKQWPEVPRGPLVEAITTNAARCARSDDPAPAAAKGFAVHDLFVEWESPPIEARPARPTGAGRDGGPLIQGGSNQERRPMTIIACTPKHLPHDRLVSASVHALKPPSAPPGVVAARAPLVARRAFLAVLKAKRWQTNGVRLTVGFLDDPPADLRARIVQHMNAWNKTADVLFTETDGQADVRIARVPEDGYWSYLGTDILLIGKDEPTMNLEGFTMNTRDSEFHRVVRHETGHTLGFPHEHMRRELVEKIDRDAALRYYGQSQGWTDEEIEAQVLTPIEESSLLGTERSDSDSIMCYQVPGGLTVDGEPIRGGEDIDELDYAFAGQCYPKPGAAPVAHHHDHDHDHD